MYASLSNDRESLAVWCFSSGAVTETEWSRHMMDMQRLMEWTHTPRRPCVIIHLHRSAFTPNAGQRKEIADKSAHPSYRPNLAVVSSNPLIRGAIRAFTWLQTSQPYRIAAFDEISEAVRWLEEDRGEPLGTLLDMVAEVHALAGIPPSLVDTARRQLGRS